LPRNAHAWQPSPFLRLQHRPAAACPRPKEPETGRRHNAGALLWSFVCNRSLIPQQMNHQRSETTVIEQCTWAPWPSTSIIFQPSQSCTSPSHPSAANRTAGIVLPGMYRQGHTADAWRNTSRLPLRAILCPWQRSQPVSRRFCCDNRTPAAPLPARVFHARFRTFSKYQPYLHKRVCTPLRSIWPSHMHRMLSSIDHLTDCVERRVPD